MALSPIFRGISFPFRKKGVQVPAEAVDDQLIRETLQQLILTSTGDRVMRPTLGSGALSFAFETNNELLAAQIRTTVSNAIARLESRVIVRGILVEREKSDKSGGADVEDSVVITVSYVVPATQRQDEVSVQVGSNQGVVNG